MENKYNIQEVVTRIERGIGMSKNIIGSTIQLDGEANYRRAIKDIGRGLNGLKGEFRKLSEEYKGVENSTEALVKKQENLTKQEKLQKEKVEMLQEAVKNAAEKYGENSEQVQNWSKKLLDAEVALKKTQNSLKQNESILNDTGRKYKENKQEIEELTIQYKKLAEEEGENTERARELQKQIIALKEEQSKLTEEMRTEEIGELNKRYEVNGERLKELKKSYENACTVYGKASEKAKELGKEMEGLTKEQNELDTKLKKSSLEKMQEQFAETKERVSKLKIELNRASTVYGKSSNEAKGLKEQITKLEKEQKKLGTSINNTRKDIEGITSGIDAYEETTEKATGSTGTFGDALKGVLAGGAIIGGIGAIKSAISSIKGETIDFAKGSIVAINNFSAKTGETGEKLEQMRDVMTQIYNENFGEGLEDISESMAIINQQTGETGEKLKQTTENALLLRDVFGFEVNESLMAAKRLMNEFGITGKEAYNLIAQGAQNGLNQNGDLLDVINEYAIQYSSAGMSANDFFTMLQAGYEKGTWSVDKLGDAFKEFNIRMNDGTANEYLKDLGLNAEEIVTKFQSGGDGAKEAMSKISEALMSCKDDTKQYTDGVGMFGTMWEDCGSECINALLKMDAQTTYSKDALEQINSVRYDDIGSTMETLRRNMQTSIAEPIATQLIPAIQAVNEYAVKNGGQIASKVTNISNKVIGLVTYIISNRANIETAIAGITAGLAAFKMAKTIVAVVNAIKAYRAATEGATIAQTLFNVVLEANPIVLVISVIVAAIAAVVAFVATHKDAQKKLVKVWNTIKSGVIGAVKTCKNGINTTVSAVKSLPGKVSSAISAMKERVAEIVGKTARIAKEKAKAIPTNVVSAVKSLPGKVKTAISSITDKFVSVLERTKSKSKSGATKVVLGIIEELVKIPEKVLEIGTNIVTGIYKGMSSKLEWLKGKVAGFGGGIIGKFKGVFDIHSPSRVMKKEIGENIALGIAEGIREKKGEVKKEVEGVAKITVSTAKKENGKVKKTITEAAKECVDSVKNSKKNEKKTDSEISELTAKEAKKRLETWKVYHKTTKEEEITYWKEIMKGCKKGSAGYTESLKQIQKLREEERKEKENEKKEEEKREKENEKKRNQLLKSYVNNAESELKTYKKAHTVTTREEKEYWEEMLKGCEKGSDNYKKIKDKIAETDKKLADERKKISKEMEDAEKDYQKKSSDRIAKMSEDIKKLTDEYKESVNKSKESILSSFKLFEQFTSSTENNADSLITALSTQVASEEEFSKVMDKLRGRGLSDELVEELTGQGINAMADLKVIADMTDEQIKQYQELWDKRAKLAEEEATKENGGLYEETKEKIEEIQKKCNEDLKSYEEEYKETVEKLEETLMETYNGTNKKLKKKAKEAVKTFNDEYAKYSNSESSKKKLGSLGDTVVKETKKKKTECVEVGRNLARGIIEGMKSQKASIAEEARSVVNAAINSMQVAGDIHSPSKKTERLIGSNLGLGVSVGFNKVIKTVTQDIGSGMVESIDIFGKEANKKLQSTFSDMSENDIIDLGNKRLKKSFTSTKNKITEELNIKNDTGKKEGIEDNVRTLSEKVQKIYEFIRNFVPVIKLNNREVGKLVDNRIMNNFNKITT